MSNGIFPVLMAEDDENDILATRRAWKNNKIENRLHVVNDGEECLDYLYKRGKYSEPAKAPWPGILLLDINMPKLDGLSVLKRIKEEDGKFHRLPIVILTTSTLEEDRIRSFDLGVNAFIAKPIGFENLSAAVRTINLFWRITELPEGDYESE